MNLTALWFIINLFFVAAFITTLFVHRAVTSAVYQSAPSERVSKLKRMRNSLIALTVILFIGMSAAFISNMVVNG